ncbi:MAG: glucose 1-dehydrogenase [Gammaproteobacteria bacterium]
MADLKNKIALISGGARGIGGAISEAMAAAGASVIITDQLTEEGESKVEGLIDKGYPATFIKHDVTIESEWNKVIQHCTKSFGGLDILVNNAGIYFPSLIEETTLEDWRKMFSVNVEGVFLGTKVSIPEIKKRSMNRDSSGSIINLSSVAGLVGSPNHGAYTASKGAVRLFTKSSALECASLEYNIRVNSIHPGVIDTSMGTQVVNSMIEQTGTGDNEARAQLSELHPLARFGKPEEIAQTAVFLASDDSSFITGTEIIVDGGLTAK